jgi:hypothetical protein
MCTVFSRMTSSIEMANSGMCYSDGGLIRTTSSISAPGCPSTAISTEICRHQPTLLTPVLLGKPCNDHVFDSNETRVDRVSECQVWSKEGY